MPPTSEAQRLITNPDRGLGLSFLLGADYERKKQELQQELKLDYKQYVAKEMESKNCESHPQPQGLSLPIHDHLSVKEKLREERNKEYNVFLQNKAQIRRTGQVQAPDASAASLSILNSNPTPIHREQPQRRDAATLTEAVEHGKSVRTWDPGHRGRRRWQPQSPREPYSSEDELMKDKGEDLEFGHKWRKDGHAAEPENNEEWRTRGRKTNSLQMPDNVRATSRSRPVSNKEQAEFATGLLIGTKEDPTASQMKKETYKQELLKQIAEQQKNKMKEKKLELRVAATGSIDPEKEPDRIMQFGPVNRQQDSWRQSGVALTVRGKDPHQRPAHNKLTEHTEQGGPQRRAKVDSSAALSQLTGKAVPHGVSSLDDFTEGYHREFSNMLGELAIPRVASVPPPVPPAITYNYRTPYDAAYYYYGTRNPLDPHLPYFQNGPPRRESGNFHSPARTLRPSDLIETTDQHRASPLDVGNVRTDKSKQRTESVLSYQEALREQIKEREESKRREREEKEQYDAKIEAEMMAYNPWGKSGGGAPIKDQKGNIFSDLNQMHKINEESYKNPFVQYSEVRTPRPHRLLGVSDQPTPQQLDTQERYKQALKQQIDENRRKRAAEREQMRIEEEKEEKKLLEQRTRIQQEYEDEHRKRKNTEHMLEKQSWIHEPKTLRQEKLKKTKQEQEITESTRETEDNIAQIPYKKEPSPPVPAWQKTQTNAVVPQPTSAASQLSTKTEEAESAAQRQPALEKIAPIQDGHQEVMRELSALRQYLRKEKTQLEAQLGRNDGQETRYTPPNSAVFRRGRQRANASESLHTQTEQHTAGRRYSGTARVNMQNIRAFNQLKHRDTASREDVRHLYPDPPTDAQSLDIQQQVLLREQQRKIRRMKREEEQEFLELQPSRYYDRDKHGRFIHTDAVLPSDTTFIDVYSCKEQFYEQKPHQPSAEHQERATTWRTHDLDEAAIVTNRREPQIQPDAQSLISQNGEIKGTAYNQQRIRRQDSFASEQNGKSEALSGDETDTVSLRSALERRISMETVATEPWLRPGTSHDVKRSGSRPRPDRRMDPPWLTHGIT